MADNQDTPPAYEDTAPVSYEDTKPVEEAQGPTATESAIRGAVQGASMGFSDEAIGAMKAAASPMQIFRSDDKLAKLKELYQKYRDSERKLNKAAEEAHPVAYTAGAAAGGAGSLALGGGEILGGLKGAAALGAITGLGTSEADVLGGEYGKAAGDVAIGAGLGAVGQKLGTLAGKLVSPAALREGAAQSAASVVGAKGLPSQMSKVGQAVLKSNALQKGISEEGLGALRAASDQAEQTLQPLLARAQQGLSQMNPEEISSAVGGDAGDKVYGIMQKAIDSIADQSSDVTNEFAQNIAPKVQDYIMKLKEAGNDPVRLNQIKRAAYQQAQDAYTAIQKAQRAGGVVDKVTEDWAQMSKQIGESIAGHIEQLGELAAPSTETTPGLGQMIKSANADLGGLAGAKRALTSKLAKGDGGFDVSSPASYMFGGKYTVLKDIMRNLGGESAQMTKAQFQQKAAQFLENKVGEGAVDPVTKAVKATLSSTPVQEAAQVVTGPSSYIPPQEDAGEVTPMTVSRAMTNKTVPQLKDIADFLSTTPGFEAAGSHLNKALANNDFSARNAAIYNLASNPVARKLLKEKGLLAQ